MPLGDAFEGLVKGSKNAGRIREVLKKLAPEQPSPPDMHHYVDSFREALADDLNTPLAFVVLFEWVLEAERRGGEFGDNDLRVMELEVLEWRTWPRQPAQTAVSAVNLGAASSVLVGPANTSFLRSNVAASASPKTPTSCG